MSCKDNDKNHFPKLFEFFFQSVPKKILRTTYYSILFSPAITRMSFERKGNGTYFHLGLIISFKPIRWIPNNEFYFFAFLQSIQTT
jgi:hypothetical protein